MTRNAKQSKQSSSRRILLVAPVLAVVIVGLTLYGAYSAPPKGAVQNYHTYFEIGIVNRVGDVRYVLPDQSIGVPGGFMSTTKYLSDGLSGNYPLYSSPYSCANTTVSTVCAISVYSKVPRQYTLGDFFAVWGVPISPYQTLSTAYTSNSTSAGPDFTWTMCTSSYTSATSSNNAWVPSNDWGSHVLVRNEVVLLDFSDQGHTCNS